LVCHTRLIDVYVSEAPDSRQQDHLLLDLSLGDLALSTSTRDFHVKFLAALPDPLVFGLIAALASLLWPVATATVHLGATPDCWIWSEEPNDELEDVNRGCYADQRIDHGIASSGDHHGSV
jgi:hypothetical protein